MLDVLLGSGADWNEGFVSKSLGVDSSLRGFFKFTVTRSELVLLN